MILAAVILLLGVASLEAQEAGSGFDLRATFSGILAGSNELTAAPRDGAPVDAGLRAVLYPAWKLGRHWIISGVYQIYSRPYFYESFSTQGHGVQGNLLQGYVGYSRVWGKTSLVVRAGELSTAFGSFMLRYDDAVNPLIDLPIQYGYYYNPVSFLGVAGAQADVTSGRWDARAQFANSSPANPRSVFAKDQYANWVGGFGFTILQGFRIGSSAYRGPYLDRQYAFFFPGEANPIDLPATAIGLDVEYAHGHWNLQGELQRFQMDYHQIPTLRQNAGYAEARRVLNARWYLAARGGYLANNYGSTRYLETAVGFRPGNNQLLKIGYEIEQATSRTDHVVAAQFVTTLHPLSLGFGN